MQHNYVALTHRHKATYVALTHGHKPTYVALTHGHKPTYVALTHGHKATHVALTHDTRQHMLLPLTDKATIRRNFECLRAQIGQQLILT